MKHPLRKFGLSAVLAAVLVACGGSGDDGLGNNAGEPPVAQLQVMGDSLSDSGTFHAGPGTARTFTVQDTDDEPYVLWVERIAKAYDLAPLCAAYRFNGQAFLPGPADCSNYAVGGARINNALQPGGNAGPLSIPWQLAQAGAAGWDADDLLVLDGGGNDMADLVTAYLGAAADHGAAYRELLLTLLPASEVDALLQREQGAELAAIRYLQTLADVFADAVVADGLDRGAERVVIANMPTVTHTPKFQLVLGGIELAFGAAARAEAEQLFGQWIAAFNSQLAANFAGEPRVLVVDMAERFDAYMADPARFGLTNVQIPVCGADGFTQVPQRSFDDCTAAALTATPPPGSQYAAGTWWQHFLFADSFHPTPYGHQLMGELALQTMQDAGWR